MRNGAKPKRSVAPKREKRINDGMDSVVAEYRRNKDGTLCGPYYYRYTYTGGKRVKAYLSRDKGEEQQAGLQELRQSRRELDRLLASLGEHDGRAATSRENGARGGRPPSLTGRHWHGSELRDRRDFPTEERDRALFKYNTEDIRADLGFAISEDDYVELMRMVRGELARRSQRGEKWEDGMCLELDMSQLSSWRVGHDEGEPATTEGVNGMAEQTSK